MQALTNKFKFSGIYCIINNENGHKYIGSSMNMKRRLFTHRAALRGGYHCNDHLQNAWNKYTEEAFDCFIVEKCENDDLLNREQYYIDNWKPEYNINPIANNLPSYPLESRLKHSKTRKEKMQTGEIPITHNKIVHKYSLDGDYLETYISISKAALANNINMSQIRKNLSGQHRRGGNFQWSYTKTDNIGKYVKNNKKPYRLKVRVFNEHENYLFPNIVECSKYFNVCQVYIRNAVKKNRKFKRKYTIIFERPCS